MNKPIISIIIPTYNRASLLDFTLTSIKNQTIDKSLFEVIVVDDGSTDETRQVAADFEKDMQLFYYFQEDLGYRPASARNLGIANCNGEIVLFIDSGVILDPDCVNQHLLTHQQNQFNIIVVGYVLGIEEEYDFEEVLSKQIDYHKPEATIQNFLSNNKYLDIREQVYSSCEDNIMKLRAPWAVFWTGNISVKKSEIQKAGGFDTAFDKRWGVEDMDLGYRIFKNNVPLILNRKASSIHCPHFSDTTEKLRQEHQNKLYFHSKYNIPETEAFLSCTAINLNFELDIKEGVK
jgi:glycosyltransferase involved in cell wall biosynthesis